MSAQELLTFLFDAIACGFIFIATIDLSREIIALYNQTFVSAQRPILPTRHLQQFSPLPDPWLLPVAEVSNPVEQITHLQKPLLLLAQALAVDEVQLSTTQSTIKELLIGVNVDTLKLRDARKIAKVLGIAQKINGRDQKLAFLRSQIKLKLQQETSLEPEVIAAVRGELIAC